MTRHPLYLLYGALVIGLVAAAELRGWSPSPAREVRTTPQSIRENPGAYRPIYRGTGGRYLGGK